MHKCISEICVCVCVCVCMCVCVRVCACVWPMERSGGRKQGSKLDRREGQGGERRVAGLGKAVRGRCLGEGCSFVNNCVDVAMMSLLPIISNSCDKPRWIYVINHVSLFIT